MQVIIKKKKLHGQSILILHGQWIKKRSKLFHESRGGKSLS
jgi:hypothetical protein